MVSVSVYSLVLIILDMVCGLHSHLQPVIFIVHVCVLFHINVVAFYGVERSSHLPLKLWQEALFSLPYYRSLSRPFSARFSYMSLAIFRWGASKVMTSITDQVQH